MRFYEIPKMESKWNNFEDEFIRIRKNVCLTDRIRCRDERGRFSKKF